MGGGAGGVRAVVLGGEHQRTVRALFILRGVRGAGTVSARGAAVPHATGHATDGNVRRAGVVPGDPGRGDGRPAGIPARSFDRVPDSGDRVFFDGLAERCVVRSAARDAAAGDRGVDTAGAGRFDGEAVR